MQAGVGSSRLKRLERKFRRLQLNDFGLYLRGNPSSVCPALLCNPRRSHVAPDAGITADEFDHALIRR